MPDQYKKENAIQAYRTFYVKDKLMVKGLDWKKIPEKKPLWINEYV
jgi:hypothetical protein